MRESMNEYRTLIVDRERLYQGYVAEQGQKNNTVSITEKQKRRLVEIEDLSRKISGMRKNQEAHWGYTIEVIEKIWDMYPRSRSLE